MGEREGGGENVQQLPAGAVTQTVANLSKKGVEWERATRGEEGESSTVISCSISERKRNMWEEGGLSGRERERE